MPSAIVVIILLALAEAVQLFLVGLRLRDLHRQIADLSAAVGRDYLTGIADRRGLHQARDRLIAAGTPPAILLLDLTRFKDVNDDLGHDAGDALLCEVAARLDALAPSLGAAVGRLGGDEFVILLPHAATDLALIDAAAQIHLSLAAPFTLDGLGEPLQVSCVIGLAAAGALPEPGKPFRAADIAMYHAREHRLPHAIYHLAMTYPATADRHGLRLRDRHPAPAIAMFHQSGWEHLLAGQASSDIAHPDDIAELTELVDLLDPRSREFGTDTTDLLHRACDHAAITVQPPIARIWAEPTTAGEYRDGGFLIMVDLGNGVTLACLTG